MTQNPSFPLCFLFRIFWIALLFLCSPLLLSAAPALPLPDTVQFKEEVKLPLGINERSLASSVVSEDANVLVVETSTVAGINTHISIDKILIAEIKRGDPSLRPFVEISPELALPSESMDALYYDDKIDHIFRPFLKKYPDSPHAQAVRDAEKSYAEELQRVTKGEFRVGSRWSEKSLLMALDLKAIQLIQKVNQFGANMPLADFNKLVLEAKTCFASELFPNLGQAIDKASTERLAKLKNQAADDPANTQNLSLDDQRKDELAALIPLSGWNWDSLNKAVAMVWEAETMLKTNPPEKVAVPLDLIAQSQALMPFLLARERIIRQQSAAYADKAVSEAQSGHRTLSYAWWISALQIAERLTPPENQTMNRDIVALFGKTFMEQSVAATKGREYKEAKMWLQSILDLVAKTSAPMSNLAEIRRSMGDLEKLIKQQDNQEIIDSVRKSLAEFQAQNNFEAVKITLTTRWAEVKRHNPTPEETTVFAHAALDQSEAAFKAFKPITGYQLLVLAKKISPKDPQVKTWIFSLSMSVLAVFLVLLIPIFWLFASGGVFVENIRYRFRLKSLKKKAPKRSSDPGRKK